MSSSINNLSSYLESLLAASLKNIASSPAKTSGNNNLNTITSSSFELPTDTSQLSPFAQLLSSLQQLQESDPTKYQQVTQQIATALQNAAQTAQSSGNTAAANQLNQLATDFSNASKTGQLPNIQDLAQATGGHGHHHHAHASSAASDSDASASTSSTSSSSTGSSNSTSQLQAQILAAFQAGATQNESLNPMAIIMNAMSKAGINISNG